MRVLRVIASALVVVALAAPARADEWNKKTFLTFSGPVQIPGKTLPAGTYTFKLADSPSNRHIVQIFDKGEKKLFATILAIPDQRLQPSDKPVVMFRETAAGTPAAIRAWFYPGNTIGNEFVYPKEQAVRIAKATHESVLAMSGSDLKSGEVSRVDESGNAVTETSSTTAGAKASTEAPAQAQPGSSDVAGTSGAAPRAARRSRLPQTASPLALYELIAGLSLAGAYGVRRLRRR